MPWEVHVLVRIGDSEEMAAVHPTGGPPYRYDTEEEAKAVMRMCYPEQLRDDRLDRTPGRRVRAVHVD
jgi:hypothetical protein